MLAKQSDGDLLSRLVATGDEVVFDALVERHEQMVGDVCQRVLGRQQDAEDAVLQTFVVLWEKAASIRKADSLKNWLHGVARRVASDIRKIRNRRDDHEYPYELAQLAQRAGTPELRERQTLMEAEVQCLPEKYRTPFILHCLEGKSRKETAAELGLKEGTVASRVRKARELLQQRLAQYGIFAPS